MNTLTANSRQINLSKIAEENGWHLASVISALQSEGLSRPDAEAFADFIFTHHAEITDCEASECVTHEQWERLDLNTDGSDVEWMITIPPTLKFSGWGIVGEPQEGVIVPGPSGDSIDVTGYHAPEYWDGDNFLGADPYGIVPIYRAADGSQFPAGAKQYPYLA